VPTPAAENVVVVPTPAAEETTIKKKKSKKSKKKRDKQPSKRIRYTRSGDEAYELDLNFEEAEQEEQDVERQVIQETEYADTQDDELDLNAEDTQPVTEDTQPVTKRSRKRPWKKGDTPPPVNIDELPEEELDLDKNYYDDIEDIADEINAEEGYRSLPDSDNEEPCPYDEFEENCEDVFKDNEDKEHPVHKFEVKEPELKMTWPTIKECRAYLKDYAISKKFEYEANPNEGNRIRARCLGEDCNWEFYASGARSHNKDRITMVLKTLKSEHSVKCMSDKEYFNKHADSDW
ncbi:hypothetical protein FRX31_034355, partial [Thalictrum thalictroides]